MVLISVLSKFKVKIRLTIYMKKRLLKMIIKIKPNYLFCAGKNEQNNINV